MFTEKLKALCSKYDIVVVPDNWQYAYAGQQHEISDSLYSVFDGHGYEECLETGMPPSDFLPSLVSELIELVVGSQWKVDDVDSDDDWDTAIVKLLNTQSNESVQFTIDDVDDQDWVPVDVFDKLNQFARKHGDTSIAVFISDGPFRAVPMTHDAYDELLEIIQEFTEPY
jgi:serine/threonine protein phosphatase PrpC